MDSTGCGPYFSCLLCCGVPNQGTDSISAGHSHKRSKQISKRFKHVGDIFSHCVNCHWSETPFNHDIKKPEGRNGGMDYFLADSVTCHNGAELPNATSIKFDDPHFAVVFKPQGIETKCFKHCEVMWLLSRQWKPKRTKEELRRLKQVKGAKRKRRLPKGMAGGIQPEIAEQCMSHPDFDQLSSPEPVHRLDKATGGMLVFAKTKAAMKMLSALFSQHRMRKRYAAVVMGTLGSVCNTICSTVPHALTHLNHNEASMDNGIIIDEMDECNPNYDCAACINPTCSDEKVR